MYKRIVVAVGDDPELDTAVAYAIALAADTDAELWLLRVCTVPLIFGAPDMVTCSHLAMEHVMEAHAHLLACAVAAAEEAGVSYTATSRWGAIPDLLMRTADEADGDVIVVGSPAPTSLSWWSPSHRQPATAGLCGYGCWSCMTALLEPIWRSSMP